jgi:hypothetical protein
MVSKIKSPGVPVKLAGAFGLSQPVVQAVEAASGCGVIPTAIIAPIIPMMPII